MHDRHRKFHEARLDLRNTWMRRSAIAVPGHHFTAPVLPRTRGLAITTWTLPRVIEDAQITAGSVSASSEARGQKRALRIPG